MPHDMHGVQLKKGDGVILHGVIEDVQDTEEGCNATVKITDLTGSGEYAPSVVTNAKMVAKCSHGAER